MHKARTTKTSSRRGKASTAARGGALRTRALAAVARNKERAQALTEEIRRRGHVLESELFAVGRALRKLSEEPLYLAMGYDSFADLLRGERLMPRTTAYKLMSVTEAFTAPHAKKLGFEKAYALLAYVQATPQKDVAPMLAKTDARIGNRHISKMSVRQIRDASRRVRATTNSKSKKSQAELEARRAARKLQATLRKQGAKDAVARAERHDGEWRVALHVAVGDVGVLV